MAESSFPSPDPGKTSVLQNPPEIAPKEGSAKGLEHMRLVAEEKASDRVRFTTQALRFEFTDLTRTQDLSLENRLYLGGDYWVEHAPGESRHWMDTPGVPQRDFHHFNLPHLSVADVKFHWKRLLTGFPWADMKALVEKANDQSLLTYLDYLNWKSLDSYYKEQGELLRGAEVDVPEKSQSGLGDSAAEERRLDIQAGKNRILRIRLARALVWAITIDARWGFPATKEFIKGFGVPELYFIDEKAEYKVFVGDAAKKSVKAVSTTALDQYKTADIDLLVLLLSPDASRATLETYAVKVDSLLDEFDDDMWDLRDKYRKLEKISETGHPKNASEFLVLLIAKDKQHPTEAAYTFQFRLKTPIEDFKKDLSDLIAKYRQSVAYAEADEFADEFAESMASKFAKMHADTTAIIASKYAGEIKSNSDWDAIMTKEVPEIMASLASQRKDIIGTKTYTRSVEPPGDELQARAIAALARKHASGEETPSGNRLHDLMRESGRQYGYWLLEDYIKSPAAVIDKKGVHLEEGDSVDVVVPGDQKKVVDEKVAE